MTVRVQIEIEGLRIEITGSSLDRDKVDRSVHGDSMRWREIKRLRLVVLGNEAFPSTPPPFPLRKNSSTTGIFPVVPRKGSRRLPLSK